MTMMKALARVSVAVSLAKARKSATNGAESHDTMSAQGLFAKLNATDGDDTKSEIEGVLAGGSAPGSGIGALLEQLANDAPAVSDTPSDLDNLINGMGAEGNMAAPQHASFGTVLTSQFAGASADAIQPSADQEAAAALMISAMLQAARNDPGYDSSEREMFLSHLADISETAMAFIVAELDRPVDTAMLAGKVPPWLESQVYVMSVLGTDLTKAVEVAYLRELAGKMAVGQENINTIHDNLGVPRIFQ